VNATPHRSHESIAEILLWQSRSRIGFVAVLGTLGEVLRLSGLLRADTYVAERLGAGVAITLCGALFIAYLAGVTGFAFWLRHRRHAGPRVLAAVVCADMLLIFGTALLVCPVQHYERTLLASFFSLQLTFVDFGRRAGYVSLAGIALCFAGLLTAASWGGVTVPWTEHLWTLFVFTLGAMTIARLHGTFTTRLNRIAKLFARAEEGDFSTAYDVSADLRPDAITVVGRAYNRMRMQLATIVLTDPLSGCLNRRGFEQQLAREASRAYRARGDLAVLAVDVDHFKEINDVFGHMAGDEAIREIGAILRATARLTDVVARTGGEEFMILAPDTDTSGALRLASRLCEAFRGHVFQSMAGRRRITVSIGLVSDRVMDERIAEGLRARADEALYAAKRGGRDRICAWTVGLRPGSVASPLRVERALSVSN
jgi:diguanylate cyclase (GGDEF)-like protein